jgi:Zn-finger nucleic acid-binding protein
MKNCPRDQATLASNELPTLTYHACEHCGGVWIPGKVLTKALTARGYRDLRTLDTDRRSTMRCLDCQGSCSEIEVENCHLDICQSCHGVWFDRGEVSLARGLFPAGSDLVEADAKQEQTRWTAFPFDEVLLGLIEAILRR